MAVERLEHVLVSAQLERLVLLELFPRLFRRGQNQRNVLELGTALDLVANRVADLLGLDRDHHQRRSILLRRLNDLIAVGDVLHFEPVGLQRTLNGGQGGLVGLDTQKLSRRHEARTLLRIACQNQAQRPITIRVSRHEHQRPK